MSLRSGLSFFLLITLLGCGESREGPTPPPAPAPPAGGPTGITRNVLQDRHGDIWLATWEGIMRYDGTTFINHTKRDGLRDVRVFSVHEAADGKLWFGTVGGGAYRYDGNKFTNITKKDGLAHDQVSCFYEDRAGNLWIGTGGGISVYDGTGYRNLKTADGLPNYDINAILEDRAGTVWIASRGLLSTYDGEDFNVVKRADGGTFSNVRCLLEDRAGNVWLAGQDGLWRHDTAGFTRVSAAFTGYVFEDSRGHLWTAAEAPDAAGNWRITRYGTAGDAVVLLQRRGMFFGITEDTAGGIWAGGLSGVLRYDGKAFEQM